MKWSFIIPWQNYIYIYIYIYILIYTYYVLDPNVTVTITIVIIFIIIIHKIVAISGGGVGGFMSYIQCSYLHW